MFELGVALKYLVPRKKSISTTLISLLSVGVISVVVWLVIVFLSVTFGIEKNWLNKVTSLTAPLRISPTDRYYNSYYYLVDAISSASNYTLKTVGEKGAIAQSDPYSPDKDMEIPASWPSPEKIDPVKTLVQQIETFQIPYDDYEIGGALLRLDMERGGRISHLSQMSYLLSHSEINPHLNDLILENESLSIPAEPILLPKNYRDSGVQIGDTGCISYAAPGSASGQEMRMNIYVSGFYDPGLVSLGNRCILVSKKITRLLHGITQTSSPDGTPTNGYFLWSNIEDTAHLKQEIEQKLQAAGIADYWKVTSYEDYEFVKDLLQQFRSDRLLFTLVGGIVLLVACCNIISLLILLVRDRRKEIAILQAMGTTRSSIALIFAFAGSMVGIVSAVLGSALAFLTLHYLKPILAILSKLQGRELLNPQFFGGQPSGDMSIDALRFVLIATPILALLAGLVPAIQASRIHPSPALRSE